MDTCIECGKQDNTVMPCYDEPSIIVCSKCAEKLGFMFDDRRSKSIIPSVRLLNEIPQWIIASDKAAYHPWSRTIYLRKPFRICNFIHELGHHIVEIITGKERYHKLYDAIFS